MYLRLNSLFFLLFCPLILLTGQDRTDSIVKKVIIDSIASSNDAVSDTMTVVKNNKKQAIDDPVTYNAEDSLIFDYTIKKAYLFGKAFVSYQDIELKAERINFDMTEESVYANGIPNDSSGKDIGNPEFKQGSEEFTSKYLIYNFKTKKGYIKEIKSKQQDGYIHSEITKRYPSGHIHMRNGKYTTCDADHPHFYLSLTKAIAIPEDKIVSGPAYVVLADIPLPIGLPFGFFPNTKSSKSGVIIPSYGEEANRGFFLRGGGYYIPFGDYADARITGDIYSKGSWGLGLASNYLLKYKFGGSVNATYIKDKLGIPQTNTYNEAYNYSITWSHRQDQKANPSQNFSANVNMSSSSYERTNARSLNNLTTNTKSSSINYSKQWVGTPFNFSGGFKQSQNSLNKEVLMQLPSLAFNVNTLYPFRRKIVTGKMKWYENIQVNYSSTFENNVSTKDSLMFTPYMLDTMENGFQHNIPLSTNIKLGSIMTITPSLNYKGILNTRYIEKTFTGVLDSARGTFLKTDTFEKLSYAQAFFPSLNVSVAPKLYGMYKIQHDRFKAIRHVLSPSVSFSFIPQLGDNQPSYYKSYYDSIQKKYVQYSIYEKSLYQAPRPGGKSGRIGFGLRNTLELKYFSKNDTTGVAKKLPLLENLDIRSGYDIYREEFKLDPFNITTGTRLFNGEIDVRLTGVVDPYILQYDSTYKRYLRKNELEFKKNKRMGRLTNASLSFGTRFQSKQGKKTNQDKEIDAPTSETESYNYGYVDFDVPWSLNFDYSFSYSKTLPVKPIVTQTIRVSGDLSLTKKWKIGFSSGYDLSTRKATTSSLNVYRDLHCWEMRVVIIPFGTFRSYNFTINVKSALLRDLKYERRNSWYDNIRY